MSLLVSTLKTRVGRSMGWLLDGDWPTQIPPLDVFNEAGELLYGSRPWSFLENLTDELNIVEGQDTIPLPDGFLGLLGFETGSSSVSCGIRLTTIQNVMRARVDGAQIRGTYYGCIQHAEPTADNPQPTPVLAIGPVPGATEIGAIQIAYRGKWPKIIATTNVVKIPDWMVPLYIATCCEYLGGYENEIKGTLAQRLAVLWASPLYMQAKRVDDEITPWEGPVTGTASEEYGDVFLPPRGAFATFIRGS